MARTKQTIDDRIKKAEEAVIKTKEKYEAALEELNLLVKKKKEMESKELMKAFEKARDRSKKCLNSSEEQTMILKMAEPGKAELIMMFLNQWDTACGADKDFRIYQVEAEEIAQKTRKNSTLETVA